jgi:TM2 domain-containing membrane protein YozV
VSDQPGFPPESPAPVTPPQLPMEPPAGPAPAPPAAPQPAVWAPPGTTSPGWVQPEPAPAKSRLVAAVLALLLGGFGIHKFYLGRVALGVVYLVFCWTGIPSFIAWIEGILYLLKSDEAWAAEYGGPVERPSGLAVGCVWLLAVGPLLAFLALLVVVVLIFIGAQATSVA